MVCQIDEYFTRTILLLPVSDIITVTTGDFHPPLYYLMGKAVAELSAILGVDLLYSLKLLSIAAYAYLIKNNKGHIKYWLISVAVIIVLYLPWVPHLLSQMAHVHNGYWIPEITWESALLFYGYYGYNENVLIAILSLVILAAIIFMYIKEKSSFEKTDQNLILSGIAVYLGTITLGVLISFLFKPILDGRYLMAASSVLWLTIAIIISKLENKKMFYLSLALVAILLISGVANTVNTYDENYQKAIIQENYFNNITSDNNSVLIISTTNDSMYFLSYSDKVDLYILNVSDVFGLDMERIHQTFDFKNVNASKIDDFIADHPDKNIYLISWNEPKINSSYEVINQDVFLYFTKINETSKNLQ